MAKIYGLFGSMTGKLADTVMAVRNGEQLARKYQPIVYNPSTPAQVAQRAKMKLLSQLSAVMAPVIAIPRQGSVSSRNLFTKLNFPTTSFDNTTSKADIALTSIQITKGVIGLGSFSSATRTQEGITVVLTADEVPADIDRVVYILFAKAADNTLEYRGSAVSETRGSGDGAFAGILPAEARDIVIYAYGVRDNTEAARTVFGNLTVITAETVASLLVSRTFTEADVTVTKTLAATVPAASRKDDDDEKKKTRK